MDFTWPYYNFCWRWLPFFCSCTPCWTCAPSRWNWPLPKPHPLWIDSRSVLIARYHATWQEAFQYIVWFQRLLTMLPSSQFLLFTPFPAFVSYAEAQLGGNLGESASLAGIHLVSISKLPPFVPLIKLPKLPAFIGFQYLYLPPSHSATSWIHLVSISEPLPGAPQQFPAFFWLHIWHPCGLPTISCKHLASISKALPHLGLSAISCFMWFQYLGFSCPRISTTSCMHRHLGSTSLRSYGLNIYTSPRL